MNFRPLAIGLGLLSSTCYSQTLPASRAVDWILAGLQDTSTTSLPTVLLQDRDAVGDGVTPNDSLLAVVISELTPTGGVIQFPNGDFLFNENIDLPSGIILRGNGSDLTTLSLSPLSGGHGINVSGALTSDTSSLVESTLKDQMFIRVNNPSIYSPLDWIRTSMDDADLVTSTWASGSVGQISQIASKSGDTLFLRSPLRLDHLLSRSPLVTRMEPVSQVGLECLGLVREDNTLPQQSSNVRFGYAVNCWIQGVESAFCNFSHFEADASSNIQISGCYIHEGFSYGSGGRAYGVVLHYTSGQCLVQDNTFESLRHSMLLQAGANGNVFAYNYSIDPNWESSPSDAAGDIVLHGNYPYANLFEQNMVQNMVIDNSHGPNGPYNTFLRNRGESYGIFFSASNSPSQNFLGNEVTNTSFPYSMVNYTILGVDQFIFGNNDKGTIDPEGTENLPDVSYAYMSRPAFVPANQWGAIGTPNPFGTASIPARDRFQTGMDVTVCEPASASIAENEEVLIQVFPNPATDRVWIESSIEFQEVRVYDATGRITWTAEEPGKQASFSTEHWTSGVYLVLIRTSSEDLIRKKLVK